MQCCFVKQRGKRGEICLCLLSEVPVLGTWRFCSQRTREAKTRSHILWHFSWLGSRSQTYTSVQVLQTGEPKGREIQRSNIQAHLSCALSPPSPLPPWLAYPLHWLQEQGHKTLAYLVLQPKVKLNVKSKRNKKTCSHFSLLFLALVSNQ